MASPSNSTRSPDIDRSADSVVPPIAGTGISPYHASPIVPNRIVPAWVLSLVLHTLILVVILLMLAQFPRGAAEVESRAGGIVLVDLKSKTTEYLSEGDVEETSPEQQTAAASAAATPQLELAPELPGLESTVNGAEGVADLIADGIDGVDKMTTSEPMGKIGGKVTTEVFGVTGTGSRFVYVFDRSESMDGYNSKPILAARQQLIQSIESLHETNQFQIIFYNDRVKIFNPDGEPTMYFANDKIKRQAKNFVNGTHPKGGTDHLYALKQAFKLNPDVIFLLTDAEGGFTNAEIAAVVRNNRSAAVINTVEFGVQRGQDRSLERVSKTSGGQYVFKNIRTLRVDR